MRTEQEVAAASLALSVGLTLIVAFLTLRQYYEERARGRVLSAEDTRHFRRQDRRRWLGIAALQTIGLLALLGSLTPIRIQGRGNWVFVVTWLAVMFLVALLLVLALYDWLSTRRYGRRRRKELLRDSIEEIRRDRRRRRFAASQPPGPDENGED